MSTFAKAVMAAMLFTAAPALADSPFNGTWKGEIASAKVQAKPDRIAIKNGMYSCTTCLPAYSVKADGGYHAVAGKDYWDQIAVSVVDDHTVKYSYRKAGKVVATATEVVSADANTLSRTGSDTSNGSGVAIETAGSAKRVGAPTPGAHLISGAWDRAPASAVSDAALMMTIGVDRGALHLTTGTGETLDARLGGAYAANVGDPGGTMTRAEQIDPRTLRLTDMRQGKVVQVSTYTIAADGVLHGSWRDPRNGAAGMFIARKQ